MTATDCRLSVHPESHANTNYSRFKLIRTVNNEPGRSCHRICHSYTQRTKRNKRRKKQRKRREQTTEVMSHILTEKARQGKTWWGLWGHRPVTVRETGRASGVKGGHEKNNQGDGESLELVDNAVVSCRCQLESGDVFSRHCSSERELFVWNKNRAKVLREVVAIVLEGDKDMAFPWSISEI